MGKAVLMVMLIGVALLPVRRGRVAADDFCSATDTSEQTYRDQCGNTEWELKALVGSNEYDEGSWGASGACYQGFHCDGNPYSGVEEGKEYLMDLHDAEEYDNMADQWYWDLDDWEVSYENQRCSNGFKGATTYTLTDIYYCTMTYLADCG